MQDKQDWLFKEIKRIWDADQFNYENVMKLDYLDACVAESLRLYDPSISVERVATQDLIVPGTNLKVKKGFLVKIPTFSMHRDPEYFPDPENFKPERFLQENRNQIRPFTYMPFGVGPRHCISMRFVLMVVKLAMARILLKFRFERSPNTEVTLQFAPKVTLSPKNVTLKVSKRDKN